VNALDKLEAFASFHGADFYRLPRNASQIRLEKSTWTMPEQLSLGGDVLIPFMAGETLDWQLSSTGAET
jgi:dihydroorotase